MMSKAPLDQEKGPPHLTLGPATLSLEDHRPIDQLDRPIETDTHMRTNEPEPMIELGMYRVLSYGGTPKAQWASAPSSPPPSAFFVVEVIAQCNAH